jgi:hypothetical protein
MPTCQLVTCMDLHSNRGCSLRFSSNRGCLGFHLLNKSLLFAISMESLAEDLLKSCLFHWKWARVNLALHFLDNFVCLVWCIIWTLSATKIPSWIETTMKSNMDNQTQMRTIWVAECNSWSPQPMPFPSYWMLVDYVREHGPSTGEWKPDLDHEESKQLEIDNFYLFSSRQLIWSKWLHRCIQNCIVQVNKVHILCKVYHASVSKERWHISQNVHSRSGWTSHPPPLSGKHYGFWLGFCWVFLDSPNLWVWSLEYFSLFMGSSVSRRLGQRTVWCSMPCYTKNILHHSQSHFKLFLTWT